MQQASAQVESTTPAPQSPTLPFTPFSLQQQETVPEEQQPTDDEGDQSLTQVPPTGNATGATTMTASATNDTRGGAVSELPSSASEPPLIAEIIANATQVYTGATIKFDASIRGGAPPYSYSWSVPDFGVIDQDRSITQMFFEPGTFNYILTVTDSRGKTVTDNVQIVISELGDVVAPEPGGAAAPGEGPLPPGRGGDVVAPEPGGAAPLEEEGGGPIQEPGVPPPTVGEGGDTGRGPQGGVTVETGGTVNIYPNATSGFTGDNFELKANIRGLSEISYAIWCCTDDVWMKSCNVPDRNCMVVGSWTAGTYDVCLWVRDSEGEEGRGCVQIHIRERLPGGAVAPEPGGIAPTPQGGGPPLPIVPEPGGIAPPGEEGVPLTVEIIPNATQVVAPAYIKFDSEVTGGTEPYSYQWKLAFRNPIFSGAQLVAVFNIAGTYTVILNVTDSTGRTGSDTVEITVGGLSELPPSDLGEVITPPEGGGVLPPPETGQEGQRPGALLQGTVPPSNDTDTGQLVSPPETGQEGQPPLSDDTGEEEQGGTPPPSSTTEEQEEVPSPDDDTGGEG